MRTTTTNFLSSLPRRYLIFIEFSPGFNDVRKITITFRVWWLRHFLTISL